MILRARLLVATPSLLDPNFFRTVVLVCEHDDDGALGLVLNRPTDMAVDEVLPEWRSKLSDPTVVFVGGPVQRETAVGLARWTTADERDGWMPVFDGIGLIDLGVSPDEVTDDLSDLRVFSGYAGWGPGQLDAEVEAGDWFVIDALDEDPFTSGPEGLWRSVLQRQPGRLRLFAFFPEDPRSN